MSPFEEVSDQLAVELGALTRRAGAVVLVSAATALRPGYLAWRRAAGVADRTEVLDRALRGARDYATGSGTVGLGDVLAEVEESIPAAPSDIDGFTVAQDCWICADSAVRVASGTFDAADAAWYLLEPRLQAASERLFGTSDPGSEDQLTAETAALRDPGASRAVAAAGSAVRLLASYPEPDDAAIARCETLLRALDPAR